MSAALELPRGEPEPALEDRPASNGRAAGEGISRRSRADDAMPPPKKRWMSGYSAPAPVATGGAAKLKNPRFKQEACWFAAKGDCKYGEGCYYAHGSGELAPAPPPADGFTRRMRSVRNTGGEKGDDWDELLCPFFQVGCCWFAGTCVNKHEMAPKDSGYKTSFCTTFHKTGSCPKADCPGAHGYSDLRTPKVWQGVPGYKASLCTFYVLDDLECGEESCVDAHGPLDLRRLPLSVPPGLAAPFDFCDAHVHLDQVLLARRYGTCWFYKRSMCKYTPCKAQGCVWAHGEADRRGRLEIEKADLEELAGEMRSLAGGSFRGCVHSCCDLEAIEDTVQLVEWGRDLLGGRVYAAFGVHPTNFESYTPEGLAQLEAAFERCGRNALAWGECGLDYYRRFLDIESNPSVRLRMCEVFAAQACIAVRRGLPLVVHSRDAEQDTLRVLRQSVPREHPVYFHSFMGSVEVMREFLEGWPRGYVGIAGCINYPAAWHLAELARALPLERLLLETDGPYMAPNPHRGEESHPGHIPWIADGVAKVKGVSTAAVLTASHANFVSLYGL